MVAGRRGACNDRRVGELEAAIGAFLERPPPELAWVAPYVAPHRFLPLYLGRVAAIGVTPAGRFVEVGRDALARVDPLEDPVVARVALAAGARRYPHLAARLAAVPPPAGPAASLEGRAEALAAALGWSREDAEANRRGKLSRRQRRQRWLPAVCAIPLALAATALVHGLTGPVPASGAAWLDWAIGRTGLVAVLVASPLFATFSRVETHVSEVRRDVARDGSERWIFADTRQLDVPPALVPALRDGERLRLYTLRYGGQVFGAEPIRAPRW